jgi:uncharacterized protein
MEAGGRLGRMTELVQKKGFDFCFDPAACRHCGGRCCRGESGYIWVNGAEIERIAAFLRTNIADLISTCLYRVGGRLSIRERRTETEHVCLFFDKQEGQCAIYEVRPAQCRRFPFWSDFKTCRDAVMRECPGVKPCRPERRG